MPPKRELATSSGQVAPPKKKRKTKKEDDDDAYNPGGSRRGGGNIRIGERTLHVPRRRKSARPKATKKAHEGVQEGVQEEVQEEVQDEVQEEASDELGMSNLTLDTNSQKKPGVKKRKAEEEAGEESGVSSTSKQPKKKQKPSAAEKTLEKVAGKGAGKNSRPSKPAKEDKEKQETAEVTPKKTPNAAEVTPNASQPQANNPTVEPSRPPIKLRLPGLRPPGSEGYKKYNAKFQNFPPGEIQHNRTPKADGITWLIDYEKELEEGGKIFFFNHQEHLGGPFSFLSNFYDSKFFQPDIHPDHQFRFVEQAYQYRKAVYIGFVGERFSDLTTPATKSTDLVHMVLDEEASANKIARVGRLFAKHPDTKWRALWASLWEVKIEKILLLALTAKFEQNEDLKEQLMMTGNFELIEASKKDKSCGIGYYARDALGKEDKWGRNMLGKLLMTVRENIRKKEGGWPTEMAFEYYRAYEEMLANERSGRLKKGSREDNSERKHLRELKAAWLAQRGKNSGPSGSTSNTQQQTEAARQDWVYQRAYTVNVKDSQYSVGSRVEKLKNWIGDDTQWPDGWREIISGPEAFQLLNDALFCTARASRINCKKTMEQVQYRIADCLDVLWNHDTYDLRRHVKRPDGGFDYGNGQEINRHMEGYIGKNCQRDSVERLLEE